MVFCCYHKSRKKIAIKDLNETKHPPEMLNEQIATVTNSKA